MTAKVIIFPDKTIFYLHYLFRNFFFRNFVAKLLVYHKTINRQDTMRKYFALLMILCCIFPDVMHAQELTVESMQVTNDLSASQYRRADLNGEPCGLVKVRLATLGATFEGNVIPPVEYKTGEYWVYMTKGSRELHVKHLSFLPVEVHFADYGISGIQPLTTYTLTLVMPHGSVVVDDGLRYLVMTVEPANATVYIDNQSQPLQNGTLTLLLPMGNHSYRVEAPAYESKSGTFTIGNEKLSLPVTLQSNMATLSVSAATQGTQIYVNDQLRGTSSWTGSLPPGAYRIEGRLQGYRNHRQNVTLAQRGSQQVSIPALQAIVGNLNVNYQPTNAEVWIDGRKAGTSPDVFRNIIVGSHTVELRAAGYTPKQDRVNIEEGKTAMLTGALERQQSTAVSSSSSSSSASSSGAAIETITVNGVSFNMVRVHGGTFTMGATKEQGSDDYDYGTPVAHQVTLSTYSIGETEVTQALWQAVMGSNPSKYKGNQKPVEQVSWDDCQTFISKLNQLTGRRFRLPTEAEWEYAARGGRKSQRHKYSGGDSINDVAWYGMNARNEDDYGVHVVKSKQSNELGLYDMSGNVSEWCQDRYDSYSRRSQTNPTGPSSGSCRVNRGGCWTALARHCRVSYRDYGTPDYRSGMCGLRLALQ